MPARKFIILFVWMLSALDNIEIGFAQTGEMDSLKLALSNAKEDTNKVNALNALSTNLFVSYEYERSHQLAKEALALAKKIGDKKGEGFALANMGAYYADDNKYDIAHNYYRDALKIGNEIGNKKLIGASYQGFGGIEGNQGNYIASIKYFDTALTYYRQIGSKKNIARIMRNFAMVYSFQSNYPEATRYTYLALKYYEEAGDESKIAECYSLSGNIHKEHGNLSAALKDYFQAWHLYEIMSKRPGIASSNDYYLTTTLYSIGEIYLLQKKPADALDKFNAALKILDQKQSSMGYLGNKSFNNTGIGKVYELFGDSAMAAGDIEKAKADYSLARNYYQQSIKLNVEKGYGKLPFENDITQLHIQLGNISVKLHEYIQARNWLEQALVMASDRNIKTLQRDSYLSLSKLDEITGNPGKALEHYKRYILYRDSIINDESVRKTEGYKMQYEFDKKEESLKQKQFITEAKLGDQKKQRYFYWVGLAMLALLSFFVFLNFRYQKKLNRLAAEGFNKEKVELELQALRAQLNPHFIFNCISSIDGLIQNNEKYNATTYLNKFAKLMRNVLEGSKENTVSFSKDIETIKLYLDLEQLRNEDKYSTQLIVSDELLNSDYHVPPLVVQPFVENAIQHGLKNKPGKNGILKIDINRIEDHVEYVISDNGIGRHATKKNGIEEHKSYGVQMSADRIKLFNNEEYPSVKIEDKIDNGIINGTTVTVKLKIK